MDSACVADERARSTRVSVLHSRNRGQRAKVTLSRFRLRGRARGTFLRRASDRGVVKQDSDKSLGGGDGDASPDSVVGPTDAKSKRELELEKRVAALEESLSQTQVRLSEEQLRLSEQD